MPEIITEDNIGPDDEPLVEVGPYLVEVNSINSHTYQVYAQSLDDAKSRYSDGMIVNSETTTPEVVKVTKVDG